VERSLAPFLVETKTGPVLMMASLPHPIHPAAAAAS